MNARPIRIKICPDRNRVGLPVNGALNFNGYFSISALLMTLLQYFVMLTACSINLSWTHYIYFNEPLVKLSATDILSGRLCCLIENTFL